MRITAIWKNMSHEDAENQPYFGNGGNPWAQLVADIRSDKYLPNYFYWFGLFPLLTYKIDEMKESKVNWVKPDKLIKAANRLKKRIPKANKEIQKVLQLYAKHAVGEKEPSEELINDLNDIITIAEFVKKAGGKK